MNKENEDFLNKVTSKLDEQFISTEDFKSCNVYVLCTMLGPLIHCTLTSRERMPRTVIKHFKEIKARKRGIEDAMNKHKLDCSIEDSITFWFKMENPCVFNNLILAGKELLKGE